MKNFEEIYKGSVKKICSSKDFTQRTLEKLHSESSAKPFTVRKAMIIFAAVLILAVLSAGTVYAVKQLREVRLSESAQFSSAADTYTERVNRSVEHDGLTLTLSEALYENGKLYVTFNQQSKKYADALAVMPAMYSDLLIDGNRAPCDSFGTCSNYSGNSLYTVEFDLTDISLENTHHFTVSFDCAEIMLRNGETVTVKGPWEYSFDLNISTLESNTEIYLIEKDLSLDNGDIIRLDKIVCTPLSQRLYYRIIPAENNKLRSYRLFAKGSGCEFVFSEMSSGRCESVNICPDNFDYDENILELDVSISDRYDNILLKSVSVTCSKQ